jgi:hypothetical protein
MHLGSGFVNELRKSKAKSLNQSKEMKIRNAHGEEN